MDRSLIQASPSHKAKTPTSSDQPPPPQKAVRGDTINSPIKKGVQDTPPPKLGLPDDLGTYILRDAELVEMLVWEKLVTG